MDRQAKPAWLKRRLPSGPEYERLRTLLRDHGLTTVCREAQCPNQFECFARGTATFMILGERCTRNCRFCAVGKGGPVPPDIGEPERVATAVELMRLRHAVVTSVTRDDLSDGGAAHFAATIAAIRRRQPHVHIEVLIPDFQGDSSALETLVQAGPDIVNHNIETVTRLYPLVRPEADAQRSLELLRRVKSLRPGILTKTGLMVGLGETDDELFECFRDIRSTGCDILTVGQYLQPSSGHLPVMRFVSPEQFQELQHRGMGMGFAGVAAGPFVRSSYDAERLYLQALQPRGPKAGPHLEHCCESHP